MIINFIFNINMYKYIFFVVLGILIYLYYNRIDNFSVGGPNYLFVANRDEMGGWSVLNTMSPFNLSDYQYRFKTTFEFDSDEVANQNLWMGRVSQYRDQVINVNDNQFCMNNPIFVDAVETLDRLNERLTSKCPTLRMVLDKPENLTNYDKGENEVLTLCLLHNEDIISYINITKSTSNIGIHLATLSEHKNKKYMSLLLSTLIIIGKMIIFCNKMDFISLHISNPILAYFIIKI